jgi:hypothetical protein
MDTQTSSSTNETPKAKPGPKAAPKIDVKALEARIHNLEQLITRMAHQSGTAHQLLIKAGLQPYTPSKNDMSKFKVV